MPALVRLNTSDEHEFLVEYKVAKMSTTVATLMQAMEMDETSPDEVFEKNLIPLPNVKKAQLEKVLEWCEHHKDDEPKVEEKDKKHREPHVVSEWDQDFLKWKNNDEFGERCQLMIAANYLDVKGLFNDISQTIANKLHGMKAAEIAKEFHIKCDLTAEEIKEIRKKNAWCEDDTA